jgi:hypothetical protein
METTGPVTQWYTSRIPEMQEFIKQHGNAEIYVVRAVNPISEHFVIRNWYLSQEEAAANAIEPRRPENARANAVLDEMTLWVKYRSDR